MPITDRQPDAYFAEEQAPHTTAAYAYVVQHEDGSAVFWTTWDKAIEITGLPANMMADDPQTFTPVQVRHGAVTANDKYENRFTALTVGTQDTELRRFFVAAAAVRLKAWIIRINGEKLRDGVPLAYAENCLIIESGILSAFSFKGQVVAARITPEPFYVDRAVPRYYFERLCNHSLYGPGCNLNKTAFDFASEILSLNPAQREIVVQGRPVGALTDHFTAGYFFHDPSGNNFACAWSAYSGASDFKLKLHTWNPEFEVGDTITLFAGCNHTTGDCQNKFGNIANFGGFPRIPNRNPVVNGV
jgi:hypothetical protein